MNKYAEKENIPTLKMVFCQGRFWAIRLQVDIARLYVKREYAKNSVVYFSSLLF